MIVKALSTFDDHNFKFVNNYRLSDDFEIHPNPILEIATIGNTKVQPSPNEKISFAAKSVLKRFNESESDVT